MKTIVGLVVVVSSIIIMRLPIPTMWRIGLLTRLMDTLPAPKFTEDDVSRLAAERDAEQATPYAGRPLTYKDMNVDSN